MNIGSDCVEKSTDYNFLNITCYYEADSLKVRFIIIRVDYGS